jgi:sec-independent protein translocase protein TatB
VFDLSVTKLAVLALIALIVFGPHELPKIAAQAGRALRDLRRIAEGAKADLKEGLGPEFQDFDFEDLNPRRFAQKHLLDEPMTTPATPVGVGANGVSTNGASVAGMDSVVAMDSAISAAAAASPSNEAPIFGTRAVPGAGTGAVPGADEDPPFDFEAT